MNSSTCAHSMKDSLLSTISLYSAFSLYFLGYFFSRYFYLDFYYVTKNVWKHCKQLNPRLCTISSAVQYNIHDRVTNSFKAENYTCSDTPGLFMMLLLILLICRHVQNLILTLRNNLILSQGSLRSKKSAKWNFTRRKFRIWRTKRRECISTVTCNFYFQL